MSIYQIDIILTGSKTYLTKESKKFYYKGNMIKSSSKFKNATTRTIVSDDIFMNNK